MRKINYIVLHCTGTPQETTKESILNYWKVNLGWKDPGYHFLIEKDGTIHKLLSIEKISNGVKGYNSESIHISYIGGVDTGGGAFDNRTPRQILSQVKLLVELSEKFPNAKILGHRDFKGANKECPSFDVKSWKTSIGL